MPFKSFMYYLYLRLWFRRLDRRLNELEARAVGLSADVFHYHRTHEVN